MLLDFTQVNNTRRQKQDKRDQKDVLTIIDVMKDRSPFADDTNLRNIETGVVADRSVNADNAKEVGDKIIKSIKSRTILEFCFKRKDQIVTMASKTSLKIDRETVHVDPQLLFQRCTTAANRLFDDISEIFKYELCNIPSSLFEKNRFPRESQKPLLADVVWENTVNDGRQFTGSTEKYPLRIRWGLTSAQNSLAER